MDSYDDDCHSALKSPIDEDKQKIDKFEVNMNLKLKSLNNLLDSNLDFYSRMMEKQAKVEMNKNFMDSKHFRNQLNDLMSFRRLQFEIEYEQHLTSLRDNLNKQIEEIRLQEPNNYTNEIIVDNLKIFQRKSNQMRRSLYKKYNLPLNELSNSVLSRSQTNYSIKSNQSDLSNVIKLPPIDTRELDTLNRKSLSIIINNKSNYLIYKFQQDGQFLPNIKQPSIKRGSILVEPQQVEKTILQEKLRKEKLVYHEKEKKLKKFMNNFKSLT